MSAINEIWDVYKRSKKKNDDFWTEWLSRPFAAANVWVLLKTPITPNQVTLIALAWAVLGCAILAFFPTYWGGVVGWALFQIAFIFDCTDGQLARMKGIQSEIGHYFDFFSDEIKALSLLMGLSFHLYFKSMDPLFLMLGLIGLLCLSSGVSATALIRNPIYPNSQGYVDPATVQRSSWGLKRIIEWPFKRIMQYPSSLPYFALLGGLEYFFYAYVLTQVAYIGRTFLSISMTLAHPGFKPDPSLIKADEDDVIDVDGKDI